MSSKSSGNEYTADNFQAEARKIAQAHLWAIDYLEADSSRPDAGGFCRDLARKLAADLDVAYVIVGELIPSRPDTLRTQAFWSGNRYADNIEYDLNSSPCADTAYQSPCFYARDVAREFPEDQLLNELCIESCVATPLVDTMGRTLGMIVALDVLPMDPDKRYVMLSLLAVCAARCAAVLQLHQREQELEQRVSMRTRELKLANDELRKKEEELKHTAYHDLLTGVANRLKFMDHLEHRFEMAQRDDTKVTIMMLDLDGFKPVNDQYGHAIGDIVLIVMAQRIQNQLRPSDILARYGGDEFAVLLEVDTDEEDIQRIANAIIKSANRPISVDTLTMNVGCTIGVATAEDAFQDYESLMTRADAAMYEAKRAGKGAWRLAHATTRMPDASNSRSRSNASAAKESKPASVNQPQSLDHFYNSHTEQDLDEQNLDFITNKLLRLNSTTSRVLGNDFFLILAKDLAEILDVHFIFIGRLELKNAERFIRTLAIRAGDRWLPNMNFNISESSSYELACSQICSHTSDAQSQFPDDKLLRNLEVDSFIGMPMLDTQGKAVGSLVAMDKRPINATKRHMVLSLFTMFATRGAAELQHLKRTEILQALVKSKSRKLKDAQRLLNNHGVADSDSPQ